MCKHQDVSYQVVLNVAGSCQQKANKQDQHGLGISADIGGYHIWRHTYLIFWKQLLPLTHALRTRIWRFDTRSKHLFFCSIRPLDGRKSYDLMIYTPTHPHAHTYKCVCLGMYVYIYTYISLTIYSLACFILNAKWKTTYLWDVMCTTTWKHFSKFYYCFFAGCAQTPIPQFQHGFSQFRSSLVRNWISS